MEKLNLNNLIKKINPVLPWLAVIALSIILLWPKSKPENVVNTGYVDSTKIETINYKIDSLTNLINKNKQTIYELETNILELNQNVLKVKGDLKKLRGDKKNDIDKVNNATTDELIDIFSSYGTK